MEGAFKRNKFINFYSNLINVCYLLQNNTIEMPPTLVMAFKVSEHNPCGMRITAAWDRFPFKLGGLCHGKEFIKSLYS